MVLHSSENSTTIQIAGVLYRLRLISQLLTTQIHFLCSNLRATYVSPLANTKNCIRSEDADANKQVLSVLQQYYTEYMQTRSTDELAAYFSSYEFEARLALKFNSERTPTNDAISFPDVHLVYERQYASVAGVFHVIANAVSNIMPCDNACTWLEEQVRIGMRITCQTFVGYVVYANMGHYHSRYTMVVLALFMNGKASAYEKEHAAKILKIRQRAHFLKEKTADRLYLLVKRAALLHKE